MILNLRIRLYWRWFDGSCDLLNSRYSPATRPLLRIILESPWQSSWRRRFITRLDPGSML